MYWNEYVANMSETAKTNMSRISPQYPCNFKLLNIYWIYQKLQTRLNFRLPNTQPKILLIYIHFRKASHISSTLDSLWELFKIKSVTFFRIPSHESKCTKNNSTFSNFEVILRSFELDIYASYACSNLIFVKHKC